MEYLTGCRLEIGFLNKPAVYIILSISACAVAVILAGASAENYYGQQYKEEYIISANAVPVIQKQHKQNKKNQEGISILILSQVIGHAV